MWVLVVHNLEVFRFDFNVVLISWYFLVLSHLILFYLADHAKHP